MTKLLAAAAALVGLLGQSLGALAADKEVTIGYQLIYSPWHVAIADSRFEKACQKLLPERFEVVETDKGVL